MLREFKIAIGCGCICPDASNTNRRGESVLSAAPSCCLGVTHEKLGESYSLVVDQVDKPPNQFILEHDMAHKIVERVYMSVSKPKKFIDKVGVTNIPNPQQQILSQLFLGHKQASF